jgi:hypothetical protein
VPRKEISEDFFISMPEVGRAIDVINRRSEKIRTGHGGTLLITATLARGILYRVIRHDPQISLSLRVTFAG